MSNIYVQRLLCDTYDVTTTKTYVSLTEFPIQGDAPIKTTGSSTTTEAVTASTLPFRDVVVGSVLYVQTESDTVLTRTVTAKASGDSVTVDAAWDLGASRHFRWRLLSSGTAASSGLVSVAGWEDIVVYSNVETFNFATNIVASVEGIPAGGTTPVALLNQAGAAAANTHTATGALVVEVRTPVDSIRVGLQGSGADTGTNYTTVWVGGRIKVGRG